MAPTNGKKVFLACESGYRESKESWSAGLRTLVHLQTTSVVESLFNSVRLRTNAAKRFKKAQNATAMI